MRGAATEAAWTASPGWPAPTAWPGAAPAGWPTSTARRSAPGRRPRRGPAADPVELRPGRYEVVLEPAAVSDVCSDLAASGFNGKAVDERRSFVRLGEQQFDPAVTLVDDAGRAGRDRAALRHRGHARPPDSCSSTRRRPRGG